jgi:hypothetical protein
MYGVRMILRMNSTYWGRFLSEYLGFSLGMILPMSHTRISFIYHRSCVIFAFDSIIKLKTNTHNTSIHNTNIFVFVKEKMFSLTKELNILILCGGISGFKRLY